MYAYILPAIKIYQKQSYSTNTTHASFNSIKNSYEELKKEKAGIYLKNKMQLDRFYNKMQINTLYSLLGKKFSLLKITHLKNEENKKLDLKLSIYKIQAQSKNLSNIINIIDFINAKGISAKLSFPIDIKSLSNGNLSFSVNVSIYKNEYKHQAIKDPEF